jgi:hypothetical protein
MGGSLSPSQLWSSTVPAFGKLWLVDQLLSPIVRPCTRLFVGLLAVPAFRRVRRSFTSSTERDVELEKDLEQWTRGAILLLVATRNFEYGLREFLKTAINEWMHLSTRIHWELGWERGFSDQSSVLLLAGRLMVAIGVIESMPDQQLFSIIHPGLRGLPIDWKKGVLHNLKSGWRPVLKGIACHHLSRSSPVLAILAVIFPGPAGWVCYVLAIVQYLIIGLVTSRDRALDVLSAFDRQIEIQRNKLIEEFRISTPTIPHSTEENPMGV